MPKLQLSFACALYDRMLPLYTGEVQPAEPRTLEALIQYQRDLFLIDKPVKVDDLFVPTYG